MKTSLNINCLLFIRDTYNKQKIFIMIIVIKNVALKYIVPLYPAYFIAKIIPTQERFLKNGDWNSIFRCYWISSDILLFSKLTRNWGGSFPGFSTFSMWSTILLNEILSYFLLFLETFIIVVYCSVLLSCLKYHLLFNPQLFS